MGRHWCSPLSLFSPHLCHAGLVHRWDWPCSMLDWTTALTWTVAYGLGIYLLNLFLAFLQPKFDPVNDALDTEMEDGSANSLPTKQDDEFKPFIRRLPEFKFWYWATRATTIAFVCTWFVIFDVPVFWPILVMYWLILFMLTSKWKTSYSRDPEDFDFGTTPTELTMHSEEADLSHDQVSLCTIFHWKKELRQEQLLKQSSMLEGVVGAKTSRHVGDERCQVGNRLQTAIVAASMCVCV